MPLNDYKVSDGIIGGHKRNRIQFLENGLHEIDEKTNTRKKFKKKKQINLFVHGNGVQSNNSEIL